MAQENLIQLLFPLLSGFISIGLAFHIWQRRNMVAADNFVLMMVGAAIWCFAHTLKVASLRLQWMVIFDNFAYLGMDIIAIGVFTFSMAFTQNKKHLDKLMWILLLIEPVTNLVLIWSDPIHHLFRKNLAIASIDQFNYIIYDHGIWGVVILSYFYAVFLFSLFLLIRFFLQANQLTRTQTAIIIMGICFPYVVGIFSMLGLIKALDQDIFPITFGLSNIFLAWGVIRFRIFDIVPIARDRIVESMHEGMIMIDDNDRIVDINPAALELIGHKEKDLLGTQISSIVPISNAQVLGKLEKVQYETQINNIKTGTTNTYEVRLSPLMNRQGRTFGRLIFLQDITRRKVLEAELHRMATTDSLTGLLNRRQFETLAKRDLTKSRRSNKPLSILMLDIDHFKVINDTYGHAIGDIVLKEFTRRCQTKLRSSDLFARFGGEEFVILLTETDQEKAEQVATRVLNIVSGKKVETSKGMVAVSTSIGIATSRGDEEIIEVIIEAADQALYQAKDRGGNTAISAVRD